MVSFSVYEIMKHSIMYEVELSQSQLSYVIICEQ